MTIFFEKSTFVERDTSRPVSQNDVDETAASQEMLDRLREIEHPDCLFCGPSNPIGFKLAFRVIKPGRVRVSLPSGKLFQSYAATLHGGLISALLDAAMTNALFSLGVVAVTGELTVRFIRPTDLKHDLEVVASLEKDDNPLYRLSAELRQSKQIAARASAKFVDKNWNSAGARR